MKPIKNSKSPARSPLRCYGGTGPACPTKLKRSGKCFSTLRSIAQQGKKNVSNGCGSKRSTITVATWLTLSRIIITPGIVGCLLHENWLPALLLLIIAAITDTVDGEIARRSGEETMLGAYLDPLADKILIVSCYVALLYRFGTQVGVPGWFTWLVVARETVLVCGAVYLLATSYAGAHPVVIRPTRVGKWTTVGHCVLLSLIFLTQAQVVIMLPGCLAGLAFTIALLMVFSGMQYSYTWLSTLSTL